MGSQMDKHIVPLIMFWAPFNEAIFHYTQRKENSPAMSPADESCVGSEIDP